MNCCITPRNSKNCGGETVEGYCHSPCQDKPLHVLSYFIFILRAAYLELGWVWVGGMFVFFITTSKRLSMPSRYIHTDNTVADSLWALSQSDEKALFGVFLQCGSHIFLTHCVKPQCDYFLFRDVCVCKGGPLTIKWLCKWGSLFNKRQSWIIYWENRNSLDR